MTQESNPGPRQQTKIAVVVGYIAKNINLIGAVLPLIRVRLGTNYKDDNIKLPLYVVALSSANLTYNGKKKAPKKLVPLQKTYRKR